jgi:hypothetical protein
MKRQLFSVLVLLGCAFAGAGADWGVTGFHGLLYMANDLSTPGLARTNRVDVMASRDRTKIVVTVLDFGPIYSSTNSGLTWTIFTAPGEYEFPLTSGADGAGFSAQVTLYPSTENQVISNVPSPDYASAGNPPVTNSQPKKLGGKNWYAVASGPDGSKLVITADASHAAPVLSIMPSSGGLVVAWPSAFTGFVLQANPDISTTNWVNVADAVTKVGGQNQVLVSPAAANRFYRLKSQ